MTAYHQTPNKKREQKYTVSEVQEWRRLMRENKWRYKELSRHIEVSVATVKKMFEKEAYGELRR